MISAFREAGLRNGRDQPVKAVLSTLGHAYIFIKLIYYLLVMTQEIIMQIKKKKPLERLDDNFVIKFINLVLMKNPKLKAKYDKNSLKEKDKRQIVKLTRNELNKRYGQFWKNSSLGIMSHTSTRERTKIYKEAYKSIFKITGKPKTLLDLGAGLNPLSYNLVGKDVFYYANELTDADCELIKIYLQKNKFNFKIIKGDMMSIDFPYADVCFLFKILDSIDVKGHKNSEQLIKKIKCNYLVVSFSNISIKNKRMNYPKRGWIEQLLKRLNFNFEKIEFPEEVFYVIKK